MPIAVPRGRAFLSLAFATGLAFADAAFGDDLARCRLPEKGLRGDVGLGFPRNANRLPTTGELHLAVLFVDFPDAPAPRAPEIAFSLISPLSEAFFSRVSYGKLKLVLEPHLHWTRMSKPVADYQLHRGADFLTHRAYLQEAITLTPDADYSRVQGVIVITNPRVQAIDYGPAFTASPGFGVLAGGREILNGVTSGSDLMSWGWRWLPHELGHAMSLVDLASLKPEHSYWNSYVGDFSLMGNIAAPAREYFGWERWQLGWVEDSQVVCAGPASLEAALTPIERAGGNKIVVVPVTETRAVVVESRHPEGFDERLSGSGLLVYVVNTEIGTYDGAIRVAPHSPDEQHYVSSLLTDGRSVTVEGVTVTALDGDRLHIEH